MVNSMMFQTRPLLLITLKWHWIVLIKCKFLVIRSVRLQEIGTSQHPPAALIFIEALTEYILLWLVGVIVMAEGREEKNNKRLDKQLTQKKDKQCQALTYQTKHTKKSKTN